MSTRNVRLQLRQAIRFIDGAPDVSGLPCDLITSGEAGEYMRRYHLENLPGRAIRFHHILESDPGRDFHDHPWDFVSVMLSGSYTEHTPGGLVVYEAPCVITRPAEALHRLELSADVWTYVVCGRVKRKWGFMTRRGWVPHDRYAGNGKQIDCDPPDAPRGKW